MSRTTAPLHPQAQQLLAQMAAHYAATPPPERPPSEAERVAMGRAGYHGIDGLAGEPEPVARVETRTILGPAGPIPVRLYGASTGAARPIVVYFHGGGFTAGDLDTHDRPLRALANRSGCLIMSVAYRLAPEHPYPAAIEDAYAAICWAAEHADAIGADAGRLAVAGDSAGGLIATAAAMLVRDRGGPALTAQVLIYPDADLRAGVNYPSWRDNDGKILNRADKDRNLSLYLPAGIDRDQPTVSPGRANEADLKGLPPALVVTAGHDPQRDEGEAYAARLDQAGVPVRLLSYPGMIHGFFQMGAVLDDARAAMDAVADALRSGPVRALPVEPGS